MVAQRYKISLATQEEIFLIFKQSCMFCLLQKHQISEIPNHFTFHYEKRHLLCNPWQR